MLLTPEQEAWRESTVAVGDGYAVFRWPEYLAFRARLGIPIELDEKACTIRIAVGEQPRITQEYSPREPKVIDTTTQHNEEFVTKVAPDAIAGDV